MLSREAGLTTDGEARCPSCGATISPGRRECPNCGAACPPGPERNVREGTLPEEVPRPGMADRSERAFVPVVYERTERPGAKKLLEPGDEIQVDRADMVEKETYQCLICGSTVPALADKCPICGTIFLSETEAPGFTGVPVARVPRPGELEAARSREVPLVEEAVDIGRPLPRPLSAGALKEADVLPQSEPVVEKKAVMKKKVVKRVLKH